MSAVMHPNSTLTISFTAPIQDQLGTDIRLYADYPGTPYSSSFQPDLFIYGSLDGSQWTLIQHFKTPSFPAYANIDINLATTLTSVQFLRIEQQGVSTLLSYIDAIEQWNCFGTIPTVQGCDVAWAAGATAIPNLLHPSRAIGAKNGNYAEFHNRNIPSSATQNHGGAIIAGFSTAIPNVTGADVRLHWITTQSESHSSGYFIYVSDGTYWRLIGNLLQLPPAFPQTSTDIDLGAGGVRYIRVEQLDWSSNIHKLDAIQALPLICALCEDSIDNDNDSATDYPNDFSCANTADNDETFPKAQCQDGTDNDGDGATDHPSDFSCTSLQDNDETLVKSQCQDGIDNDSDGAIDNADFGCLTGAGGAYNAQDNSENSPQAQCQDGSDNDNDGATDHPNDFSCTSLQDNDETLVKSQCQDGMDNDGDGASDASDHGCLTGPGDSYNAQDNDEDTPVAQCQDGIDNDNDGATDFPNDFSCTSLQDNDETLAKSQCQDGVDNDGDGVADAADFGCLTGAGGTYNAQDNSENSPQAQCQDGVDNDGDSKIDFPQDPGCSSTQDNSEFNAVSSSSVFSSSFSSSQQQSSSSVASSTSSAPAACTNGWGNLVTNSLNVANPSRALGVPDASIAQFNPWGHQYMDPADYEAASITVSFDPPIPNVSGVDLRIHMAAYSGLTYYPFDVAVSADGTTWSTISTNFTPAQLQQYVDIDVGLPSVTFVRITQRYVLFSPASGLQLDALERIHCLPSSPTTACSNKWGTHVVSNAKSITPEAIVGAPDFGYGFLGNHLAMGFSEPVPNSSGPDFRIFALGSGQFGLQLPQIKVYASNATTWTYLTTIDASSGWKKGDPHPNPAVYGDTTRYSLDIDIGPLSAARYFRFDGPAINTNDYYLIFDAVEGISLDCLMCSDGRITGTEQCDDKNLTANDGCSATCTTENGYQCTGAPSVCKTVCGDGIVKGGEQCDDKNVKSGDGCSEFCAIEDGYQCTGSPSVCKPICGDGKILPPETCDDANLYPNDGCSILCKVESGFSCSGEPSICRPGCGDGIIVGGEECDDGNKVDDDACSNICKKAKCSDGVVQKNEECDDSNTVSGDGCSSTCRKEAGFSSSSPSSSSSAGAFCGNGTLESGEECDDGNTRNGDGCTSSCRREFAGLPPPGFPPPGSFPPPAQPPPFQPPPPQQPPPSQPPPSQPPPQQFAPGARCGNGLLEPGEQCEDGNTLNADGCSATCTKEALKPAASPPSCGNGLREGAEECDDGNRVNPDTCTNTCKLPLCGDGILQKGEECDPPLLNNGNTAWCSETCKKARCGDGTLQKGEECDAGLQNSDTAPNACRTSCRRFFCSDHVLDKAEQCDDGNRAGNDGCSPLCQKEFCGDGFLQKGETCDDGNVASGDGCSGQCRREEFFWSIEAHASSQRVPVGETVTITAKTTKSVAPPRLSRTLHWLRAQLPGFSSDDCEEEDYTFAVVDDAILQEVKKDRNSAVFLCRAAGEGVVTVQGMCSRGEDRVSLTCWQPPAQAHLPPPSPPSLPQPSALPYWALLPQLPRPPATETGPEILAIMAAGAAGGFAWMRRRRGG